MKLSGITTVENWLDKDFVSVVKILVLEDSKKDTSITSGHQVDALKYSLLNFKPSERFKEKESNFKHKITFFNGSMISSEWIKNIADDGRGNTPIPEQPFVRSFSEILIDADNAKTINELQFFFDEFMINRKKYPLIYKWFAEEHFKNLIQNLKPL